MTKHRPKAKRPNLAPAALLRARLEGQWHHPAAGQRPAEELEADLQAASQGHKPEVVVPAVLAVYAAARPEVQSALEAFLPGWLARQNHTATLTALVAHGQLPAPLQSIALRWLQGSGQDTQALVPSAESSFYAAYEVDDGSQAAVCVLWYTNPRRYRATGMQFLIDYNPPWDGAIKDAFLLPKKPPQALVERVVEPWDERGQAMTPLEAGPAKRKIVRALLANRAANIRLPEDLVLLREQFFEHILPLPDLPDTPAFTVDDFHHLSRVGQAAEAISEYELTVGRRIRMEDGKELFIDAELANMGMDGFEDDLDDPDEIADDLEALDEAPGRIVPDLDDFDEDQA
jgi:hypothetical protein